MTQLSVIALVLVLPQVDLLDTAFQNNSEPLTIHAIAVVSPLGPISVAVVALVFALGFRSLHHFTLKVLFSEIPSLASAASPLRC